VSLFDADDYLLRNREPKRPRAKPTPPERTSSDGRWHVLANVEGPIKFCHRLDPLTPQAMVAEGSYITRCEQVGRLLYTPYPGDDIYPCPDCKRITG